MEHIQANLGAVGIYVALNFFILVWIANSTGTLRRKLKISIGNGGNQHLERIMRGHANAAENIPIFLIGLTVGALIGMPLIAIHLLGIIFTIGRAIHAHHFIMEDAPFKTRMIGFGIALLAMLVLFAGLFVHGIWALFG
ncbi:MAPEG family protein [Ahrensia kielensis]|uniref:MAPEG family protein n=1 Tax=Ahrensia kielensis TaxID=76980 RepID=A0ABU9T7P2_9HYPH